MEYLETEKFLSMAEECPLVDVRSPLEYLRGHLSGAINIPLFSDKERAIVGTMYAREGREAAIRRGLEMVAPKLDNFKETAAQITNNGKILLHCWRGGMRSEKMAQLFDTTGLKSFVLRGGYKAYRKKLRDDFAALKNLVILEGPTGIGKTEILKHLSTMGEQVIDLEERARHRGSAFGWIGKGEQPSTAQFQNDTHHDLMQKDPNLSLWIEGESLKIGKVTLPETLWETMKRSPVVLLEQKREIRIKQIVSEYGQHTAEDLLASLENIQTRLGNQNYQFVRKHILNSDLTAAVDILLHYYDKSYLYSLNKNRLGPKLSISLKSNDPLEKASQILAAFKRRDKK